MESWWNISVPCSVEVNKFCVQKCEMKYSNFALVAVTHFRLCEQRCSRENLLILGRSTANHKMKTIHEPLLG